MVDRRKTVQGISVTGRNAVKILDAFWPGGKQRDRIRAIIEKGEDPAPGSSGSDYLEEAISHFIKGTRPWWAKSKASVKREGPLIPKLSMAFYELYEERDAHLEQKG